MRGNLFIGSLVILAAIVGAASPRSLAADVHIFNQSSPPNPVNGGQDNNVGAWGFTATLNDASFDNAFTPSGAGPLSNFSTLYLTSFSATRGVGLNGPPITIDQHYIKIFDGNPLSGGTLVGVSTNFQNFDDNFTVPELKTFTFNGVPLSTGTAYTFAFASNGNNDTTGLDTIGRVQLSAFGSDQYTSGTAVHSNYTNAAGGGDPLVDFGLSTTPIPEPATVGLLIAAFSALMRRRARA